MSDNDAEFTRRLHLAERHLAQLTHDLQEVPRRHGLILLGGVCMASLNAVVAVRAFADWQAGAGDFQLFVACLNIVSGCMCMWMALQIVVGWVLLTLGARHLRRHIEDVRAAIAREEAGR